MTPDEQEALSRKYGSGVWMILLLSSGRFALFNHQRELISIGTLLEVLENPLIHRYIEAVPPPAPKPIDLDSVVDDIIGEL